MKQKNDNKVFNKSEIIAALQKDFTTTVKKIYINSLKKEVGFREIKVSEQKTLSRIMIDNEQRKDVVYDAQCALINQVCLDEEFNIYDLTEFDKIKLMLALYQTNMYKNEIKFTCKDCGSENIYNMDFSNVIRKLDEFDISDKDFDFENDNWKFSFSVGYPSVRRISEFYKSYAQKYRSAVNGQQLESLNSMINMDYINMYIKKVSIFNKAKDSTTDLDLADFTVQEANEIFASFPQDVLYVKDGILSFIAEEFTGKLNESFEKHKCAQCGSIYEEAADKDAQSFL